MDEGNAGENGLIQSGFARKVGAGLYIAVLVLLVYGICQYLATQLYNYLGDIQILWPWLTHGAAGVSIIAILKFGQSILDDLKTIWLAVLKKPWKATIDQTATIVWKQILPIIAIFFSIGLYSSRVQDEKQDMEAHLKNIVSVLNQQQISMRHIMKEELDLKVRNLRAEIDVNENKIDILNEFHQGQYEGEYRIPIFFPRAQFDEQQVGTVTESIPKELWNGGVEHDHNNVDANRNMLGTLVSSLAPCGEADGSVKVVLDVHGYASSEPFMFKGEVHPYSENLNLQAANMRGQSVHRHLAEAIESYPNQFELMSFSPWESHSIMQRNRGFNDRPTSSGSGSKRQDMFTRSAHIVVKDLGLCRI